MPNYMISLNPEASESEVKSVKDDIAKNGGQITKEFSLIKAFAVTMPEGLVGTFENHGSVSHVEKDQTVTTQSPNP